MYHPRTPGLLIPCVGCPSIWTKKYCGALFGDGRHRRYNYENVCSNIYRFAPFTVDTALLLTTHSTNERIPVGQMTQGVTFFKRYIRLMTAE